MVNFKLGNEIERCNVDCVTSMGQSVQTVVGLIPEHSDFFFAPCSWHNEHNFTSFSKSWFKVTVLVYYMIHMTLAIQNVKSTKVLQWMR